MFGLKVRSKEKSLEDSKSLVESSFEIDNLSAQEKALEKSYQDIDIVKRRRAAASAAAAVGAGMVVGASVADASDALVDGTNSVVEIPENAPGVAPIVESKDVSAMNQYAGVAPDVNDVAERPPDGGGSVDKMAAVDSTELTKQEIENLPKDVKERIELARNETTSSLSDVKPAEEPESAGVNSDEAVEADHKIDIEEDIEKFVSEEMKTVGEKMSDSDAAYVAELDKLDVSGVAAAAETVSGYKIQGGDNLWNILEGDVKGLDISDALEDIPEANRNDALTHLFDRIDAQTDAGAAIREKIGMIEPPADGPQKYIDNPFLVYTRRSEY